MIDLDDDIWVLGSNLFGQLGISNLKVVDIPEKIPNLKAKSVITGGHKTLIIDLDNNGWMLGKNTTLILDMPSSNIASPRLIPNLKIKTAAFADSHCVIVDMENNVWVCGMNNHGQLGLGDIKSVEILTLIPNIKAKTVAASNRHTIIIDINRNVFCAGNNVTGQLGIPNASTRTFCPIPNFRATSVSTSQTFSLFIS
jgi:alpha-tubulin suppressor-like RCC1 family protein